MSITTAFEVEYFEDDNGSEPFKDWLDRLHPKDQARLLQRLRRVEHGNFGKCKSLKDGVSELVEHFGPGFRMYYGIKGRKIVVMLGGSDKNTQDKEIKTAKKRWAEYLKREDEGG